MSIQAVSWVLERSESTLGARCLMFAIANHADEAGENCWASVATLASEARMSRKGVQAALRRLEADGHIEATGESEAGTTIYRLHKMKQGAKKLRGGAKERPKEGGNFARTVSSSSSVASASSSNNNGSRKGGRSTSRLVARAREVGFDEWLEDHAQVTGMRPPRAGTKALGEIASRFCGLSEEGYSLDELKLATRGAYANEHRRANGYIGAENVLRPTKIHGLIENGRRAAAGEFGKSVPGEHPADRRIRENLAKAGAAA